MLSGLLFAQGHPVDAERDVVRDHEQEKQCEQPDSQRGSLGMAALTTEWTIAADFFAARFTVSKH
jgi:hypothetical protein